MATRKDENDLMYESYISGLQQESVDDMTPESGINWPRTSLGREQRKIYYLLYTAYNAVVKADSLHGQPLYFDDEGDVIKVEEGIMNAIKFYEDYVFPEYDDEGPLNESFSRLPGHVINNELYVLKRNLTYFIDSQNNGNDVDPKVLNGIIRLLKDIKSEVRVFEDDERVPLSYQYKDMDDPRKDSLVEKASKLACLECDEVSTEAAWQKNGGNCPKCGKSTRGVAESKETITEARLRPIDQRKNDHSSDIIDRVEDLAHKYFAAFKPIKKNEFTSWLIDHNIDDYGMTIHAIFTDFDDAEDATWLMIYSDDEFGDDDLRVKYSVWGERVDRDVDDPIDLWIDDTPQWTHIFGDLSYDDDWD